MYGIQYKYWWCIDQGVHVLVWYGGGGCGSCCVNGPVWKIVAYILSNLNEQGVLTQLTPSLYTIFSTGCDPIIQKERSITTLTLTCCIPRAEAAQSLIYRGCIVFDNIVAGCYNQGGKERKWDCNWSKRCNTYKINFILISGIIVKSV